MKKYPALILVACVFTTLSVTADIPEGLRRAYNVLDSVYAYYGAQSTPLLRETYPFDHEYKADYLASQKQQRNPYCYLWPYSGTLSVAVAIMQHDREKGIALLEQKVIPGLDMYFDTLRKPAAYSSYIVSAHPSDRFYDDNLWVGIDFADAYALTGEQRYLARAEQIWRFIESGTDKAMGGGIWWCEQKKSSKNTCSCAPGAVMALKLYHATGRSEYLEAGRSLYEWTSRNLRDPQDGLYWDNINKQGKVDRRKFAYNSGQMMQAAVLLYKATDRKRYLREARELAEACYRHFFYETGTGLILPEKGNVWFTAIMMRGFAELATADGSQKYMNVFRTSLDHAWKFARDRQGLFSSDWKAYGGRESKWLLAQAAMAEMYARSAE